MEWKWSAEQTNQTEGHHRHFARQLRKHEWPTLADGSVFWRKQGFFDRIKTESKIRKVLNIGVKFFLLFLERKFCNLTFSMEILF